MVLITGDVTKGKKGNENYADIHFYNISRLFYVLQIFHLTTNEKIHDYYL